MVHRGPGLSKDNGPLGEEGWDFGLGCQGGEQNRAAWRVRRGDCEGSSRLDSQENDTTTGEEGRRGIRGVQEDRADDNGLEDENTTTS